MGPKRPQAREFWRSGPEWADFLLFESMSEASGWKHVLLCSFGFGLYGIGCEGEQRATNVFQT